MLPRRIVVLQAGAPPGLLPFEVLDRGEVVRRDVRRVPRHNEWLPVIPLVVVDAVRATLRPVCGVPGAKEGRACTIGVEEELHTGEGRVTDTLLHQPKVFCGGAKSSVSA